MLRNCRATIASFRETEKSGAAGIYTLMPPISVRRGTQPGSHLSRRFSLPFQQRRWRQNPRAFPPFIACRRAIRAFLHGNEIVRLRISVSPSEGSRGTAASSSSTVTAAARSSSAAAAFCFLLPPRGLATPHLVLFSASNIQSMVLLMASLIYDAVSMFCVLCKIDLRVKFNFRDVVYLIQFVYTHWDVGTYTNLEIGRAHV